ncbi:type VI secretion system protein TssA [Phyllobacterium phragmitis]|uniref:type VI secretion system protein TssA n=1 Tax=Phyllobacterium phragmitis TaxID=2670329 RepID=UPI0038B2EABA
MIAPVDEDAPCGVNIRSDPRHRDLYYRIKDARNSARGMERGAVPGEPLRLASEWHEVNGLGQQILTSISKDIEVLAWVAEAQIRINGYAGLRDVFSALEFLLKQHWNDIHSISNDSIEDKLAPLAGLNGISGEGTLIQALRLAPLVPGAGFAQYTLWDYQLAQRDGEEERWEALYHAVAEAGSSAMVAHLALVSECIATLDALTETLGTQCGGLAPPSANTHNVLLEAVAAIRMLAGLEDETLLSVSPPADEASLASQRDGSLLRQDISHAMGIASREDAFRILLTVAHYFRRVEPHSPLSMALETLVRRGRMDFCELLAELLPETQARHAVFTAAGIRPLTADKEGAEHS